MKIFKISDEKYFVQADEHKRFKVITEAVAADSTDVDVSVDYLEHLHVATEEEANNLIEVYYNNDSEITEKEFLRVSYLHELKEIRDWFAATDYIPNKVIVGEWERMDERFVKYCEERAIKRARQDELNQLLGYR